MTFNEFIVYAEQVYRDHTDWRRGQAYFNALKRVRPDLAEKIKSRENDPFYNQGRIPRFLAFVEKEWDSLEDDAHSNQAIPS